VLTVRPAPLEWRTGGITTRGVTPQQGSKTLRKNKQGQTYMAEPKANELRAFRAQVLELVKARYPGLSRLEPIFPKDIPVAIRIVFRMPVRKSDPDSWRYQSVGADYPLIWFTVAPDKDKLTRAVFDALTAANVWADDAQACDLRAIAVRHPNEGSTIEWRSLA
jgi:Holliday junction resolvase RusA-like endonuclease